MHAGRDCPASRPSHVVHSASACSVIGTARTRVPTSRNVSVGSSTPGPVASVHHWPQVVPPAVARSRRLQRGASRPSASSMACSMCARLVEHLPPHEASPPSLDAHPPAEASRSGRTPRDAPEHGRSEAWARNATGLERHLEQLAGRAIDFSARIGEAGRLAGVREAGDDAPERARVASPPLERGSGGAAWRVCDLLRARRRPSHAPGWPRRA